ncbi:MAG: SLC13 family permease [Acidimicrobiales bacterium]
MTAVRLVLLALAVAGAVARPRRLPAFAAPVVCALVALGAGATSPDGARSALAPLVDPLAFLAAALPLAALLDRLGYFERLAGLIAGSRAARNRDDRTGGGPDEALDAGPGDRLTAGLWVLSAVTVGLLNLDAAVVLLTPLYVRVARARGASARRLGFQPVVLALIASSFLPVSNLTNLIAASSARTSAGPIAFLAHLGLPGLAACTVGYLCYRRAGLGRSREDDPRAPDSEARPAPAPRLASAPGPAPRPAPAPAHVLLLGSVLVGLVVAGFVAGPSFGVAEWEIALGADVILVAATRSVPLRAVPWQTILLAAGLGVLAAAAVRDLPLASVLSGSGPLSELKIALASGAGANLVNNLPALLVSLPFVVHHHSAACGLWPLLLGVNMGPCLLVTGSLASLLWLDSMRRLDVRVGARQFLVAGVRIGLPAYAAGLAVLLALSPVLGCG